MCPHHTDDGFVSTWAAGNRIMCDFFHRGVVPRRVLDDGDDLSVWMRRLAAVTPLRQG